MSIDKRTLSEEDIKLQFITPAITRKWDMSNIRMEYPITDGQIVLNGNIVVRGSKKKADYVLIITENYPIAIVEAKDNNHSISAGMQQAKDYCQMMNVPFAYSSNGDGFQEFDFLTGIEKEISMQDFPSLEELLERYKQEVNGGNGLSVKEEEMIYQPYYSSAKTFEPRYYQQLAINKTVNEIAKGSNRLLLVMATGTGKTYVAFQIVYRLLKSNLKKKVLYLADRNILVDQSIEQDFSPLEKVIHKVDYDKDDPKTITAYQVFFSLYQQLAGNDTSDEDDDDIVLKMSKLFKPDFFDLVIVDECHRGSAKKDSNWRKILEYFSGSTQIGMTATPKETNEISNIEYFGKPIYTYSLNDGIKDGFLAPFKVYNITTDIAEGWRPIKGQRDINGNIIEDRIYSNSDYDYNIILQDRTHQVAKEITSYLKSTDRMQKTIVFCANEDHAERMRIELNNLNSDMVRQHPDYVVRITGSDVYGKSKLKYFISVSSSYPVIATTSKLLSTGVDCKMTKLIVLDKMIGSMIDFKQIIGRGTRIREKDGKTHFVVMDFRNVTRLFSDPEWDGPVEIVEGFGKKKDKDKNTPQPMETLPDDETPPNVDSSIKPIVDKNGCRVQIINKKVSRYDASGKLLKVESIIDYTKENILGEYASLDKFIAKWNRDEKKEDIANLLLEKGIDINELKREEKMEDVDDFDYICHIAFDQKPLTRKERAEKVKKSDFFTKYSGQAKEVLNTLLDTYMNEGIYEIEKLEVLKLQPFKKYGSPSKITNYFGGKDGYLEAIKGLQSVIYGRM